MTSTRAQLTRATTEPASTLRLTATTTTVAQSILAILPKVARTTARFAITPNTVCTTLPDRMSDNLVNLAELVSPPTLQLVAITTYAPTTLADTTNKLAQASSPALPPSPPPSVPVFLLESSLPLLFAAVSPVEVLTLCTIRVISTRMLLL